MQVSASSTHQVQENLILQTCHKIHKYVRRYGKSRTERIFWISGLLCRSSPCQWHCCCQNLFFPGVCEAGACAQSLHLMHVHFPLQASPECHSFPYTFLALIHFPPLSLLSPAFLPNCVFSLENLLVAHPGIRKHVFLRPFPAPALWPSQSRRRESKERPVMNYDSPAFHCR